MVQLKHHPVEHEKEHSTLNVRIDWMVINHWLCDTTMILRVLLQSGVNKYILRCTKVAIPVYPDKIPLPQLSVKTAEVISCHLSSTTTTGN